MAKSPEEMTASMIANLRERTGRSLEEWVAVAQASGLAKHGQIVKHLKDAHAMTHGYASLVAHATLSGVGLGAAAPGAASSSSTPAAAPSTDDAIDALYAGPKAALRPIHDKLVAAIRAFGPDVELAPKKTYLSLRRSKQFACIQPSTKTRVDVGIQLKGVAPEGRLEASGSFNAMVSHRVRVEDASQVDAELVAWLRRAYDNA